ncbi:conserved hypothetical protein [Anaeromyxobacter sp. Fw109-5]|nr:conserved hypothetical protein [Anaeromyxobacter sp. Fw109-5]
MPLFALVIPVLLAADLGAALPAGALPDARDPIAPLLAASPAGERFAHEEDVQSAVPPGRWLAASGATLLGDAAVTGLALAGASMSVDAWLRDRPTTAGGAVTGVAVLAALVAPPVFATWGARRAGAPGEHAGRAYGLGLLAHIGGATAAWGLSAVAQRHTSVEPGPVFVAAFAVSELALMPWVVTRALGGASLADEPTAPVDGGPSTRARPLRDPALATR